MEFQSIEDDLRGFNDDLPMIEERWFPVPKDGNIDHGFVHIGGLTEENVNNDGMYLTKTAELIQGLLYALHEQVVEVRGDLLFTEDAEAIHEDLKEIRQKFARVAFLISEAGY